MSGPYDADFGGGLIEASLSANPFAALRGLSDPNEAVFYTSGRTSNETAFLYQLMVRSFGTNNLPDCSNMCHESSGTALIESIGIGKGSVRLEDFVEADVILVVGQNPGTNHPRMLGELRAAHRGLVDHLGHKVTRNFSNSTRNPSTKSSMTWLPNGRAPFPPNTALGN